MAEVRYPSLFQINTRVRLAEISASAGKAATLDDITDSELDSIAAGGFDFVWFLGVWQTGEAARKISATTPALLAEYHRVLPDFRDADVTGSCFAIRDYTVHKDFGGNVALARLRERMRARGLKLILDFVPNHTAPDHPWIAEHPDWFVTGSEEQLAQQPQNYARLPSGQVLAYGRDPYFDGWSDTFQLNYGNDALQDAMTGELTRIAKRCDGVRCDMAMLILPDVFKRTWGIEAKPFWPRAISTVRADHHDFLFMAEVYWDLEWTLQQQGFDYTYDKRLHDRLIHEGARSVRRHFSAGLDFQNHLARFLENHDEPRAAVTFSLPLHRAAAMITFFTPGLRFFHQGQREGKKVRIPVQLRRGPEEPTDEAIARFYDQLLECLNDDAFRRGDWQLTECHAAWDGNPTFDDFVAFSWTGPGDLRRLVVVNDSDHQSQCYVHIPWQGVRGRSIRFRDLMSTSTYDRDGTDLVNRGLYLDLGPFAYHAFAVSSGV